MEWASQSLGIRTIRDLLEFPRVVRMDDRAEEETLYGWETGTVSSRTHHGFI
jgi:hypothetical protein